jgi:prophage tail gpP-like protein
VAGCGEKPEPSAPPKARQAQAGGGESGAGGGGDEEPIRQRVGITVGKRAIRPERSQVDAFLGIRLVIRNASRREQRVEARGAKTTVAAGARKNRDLEGQRPGRVRIKAEPAGARATLLVKRTSP